MPLAHVVLAAAATAPDWSLGSVMSWVLGLVCGALLMVSLTTDWQRLPAQLRVWGRALRAEAGWALLAVGSISVLAFY